MEVLALYILLSPTTIFSTLCILLNDSNNINNQILQNPHCPFYFYLQAFNFQIIIKLEFLQETVDSFFFLFWAI